MFRVEINDDQVNTAMTRLSYNLSDNSELMQELGEILVASAQDRMTEGVQPDGQPFAPRSQTTIDRYHALQRSYGKPLTQSGDLRLGLFYQHGTDHVEYGSNAIQAAVMQFGARKGAFGTGARGQSIPWGDIPARPYIGLSEDDRTAIVEVTEEWLQNTVQGDG